MPNLEPGWDYYDLNPDDAQDKTSEEETRGTDGPMATGVTGLRDYGGRDWARLENSNSDPVMNDIIGFTPCNFCDYMCMNFKFVAHLPPWYNLLQNDASLAGTFFLFDGGLTFEGYVVSMLSGAIV